jgi:hypothetical protein
MILSGQESGGSPEREASCLRRGAGGKRLCGDYAFLFAFTSHPALAPAPSEPSAFCIL